MNFIIYLIIFSIWLHLNLILFLVILILFLNKLLTFFLKVSIREQSSEECHFILSDIRFPYGR